MISTSITSGRWKGVSMRNPFRRYKWIKFFGILGLLFELAILVIVVITAERIGAWALLPVVLALAVTITFWYRMLYSTIGHLVGSISFEDENTVFHYINGEQCSFPTAKISNVILDRFAFYIVSRDGGTAAYKIKKGNLGYFRLKYYLPRCDDENLVCFCIEWKWLFKRRKDIDLNLIQEWFPNAKIHDARLFK